LEAYSSYVHGKQTLKQLKVKYKKSVPTIQKHFDQLPLSEEKKKFISEVNLVFDASYFGSRCCLLLFRANSQNLQFDIVESEKNIHYERNLRELKKKYSISSFTIDGRKGVIQLLERLFPETPLQLCQYHFKYNIVKYTTRRPRSECGQEIYFLIKFLGESNKNEFEKQFIRIVNKYSNFLKEKNEASQYSHRNFRSAFRSIKTNLPYLFTFQNFPHLQIEKTTNSCDGYFSSLKRKVNVHPGLSFKSLIRMLHSLIFS
jgi:transposase-like protein